MKTNDNILFALQYGVNSVYILSGLFGLVGWALAQLKCRDRRVARRAFHISWTVALSIPGSMFVAVVVSCQCLSPNMGEMVGEFVLIWIFGLLIRFIMAAFLGVAMLTQ